MSSSYIPDSVEPRPAIALKQVSKVYANGTLALHELNLAIAESQFVSLVGPSGCGKSTILRLIAELGSPTSGTIEWNTPALKPSQRKASPRKLAFVFQEAALMPWANVVQNVELPLKLAKTPKRQAAATVAEAIALVGLEGFERAYPRELSGGMQMRVSIARALVTQPDVLLMDEPFGALDEMTRSKLNSDLLTLWSQKRWTVVFVTHNIYEAVYLSNRVVVMAPRPGRVIADITVNVPYPRTVDFRMSATFNEYCREIFAHLSASGASVTASHPPTLFCPKT